MEHRLTLLFYVLGCLTVVFGYPSGKIGAACDTMRPSHGNYAPQTTASTYNITVDKTTFMPGDNITVTLKASDSSSFKGFLLQARTVGGNAIIGTFTTLDMNAQLLTCGNVAQAAVSHTSNSLKNSTTVVWKAPEGAGPIRFIATFLHDFTTFWVGVQSDIVSALQMSNTMCGSQKFCFSSPDGCSPDNSDCLFMSSSPSRDGTGYVFEMSGLVQRYVAIGFSSDRLMGNDDIYICTTNSSGSVLVQHGYNIENNPVINNTITTGTLLTSYVGGVVKCTFITQNPISLPQRSSTNPMYYIFLVYGRSLADGTIQQHIQTKISSTPVDLSSYLSTTAQSGGSNPLVRGHGALMLIAWMTTGSIGMIMARYMKSAAAKPVLGKAAWFQSHFGLMILTVILTIIAFIMIFVKVAGWSETGAHPILGCIVMILAFFQPILALFRPDPKSNRRFIFNWGHSLNALVIKILAVAAIFLGLKLVDRTTDEWMPKVMGGFFAWEVLFYIILETNGRLKTKDLYENPDKGKAEKVTLVVFIAGNVAFLISLLIGIGSS